MSLNPLLLLILRPVALVGFQPEERGFPEDRVNKGDQSGCVVGLGRTDCDRFAGFGRDCLGGNAGPASSLHVSHVASIGAPQPSRWIRRGNRMRRIREFHFVVSNFY